MQTAETMTETTPRVWISREPLTGQLMHTERIGRADVWTPDALGACECRDGAYFVGALPVDIGTYHQCRMQEHEREENAARDAELREEIARRAIAAKADEPA